MEPEAAQAAIDKLADAGWQDDARFAASLLRNRAQAGYGPAWIRAELGTHGLASDAIAAALATFEGDWVENARRLARVRFGGTVSSDRALQAKAMALLLRRGFGMEQARAALRDG